MYLYFAKHQLQTYFSQTRKKQSNPAVGGIYNEHVLFDVRNMKLLRKLTDIIIHRRFSKKQNAWVLKFFKRFKIWISVFLNFPGRQKQPALAETKRMIM